MNEKQRRNKREMRRSASCSRKQIFKKKFFRQNRFLLSFDARFKQCDWNFVTTLNVTQKL